MLDFILLFCAFHFLSEPMFDVSFDVNTILMVSCITSLASFIRTFIWVDVREEEQFFTLDRPYL